MSEHELWNELGNLYYLSGSYEQAAQAYNKAIHLENDFGKPYSNLALVYAKQAKYEAAIELYKESLDLLENNEEKAATWGRIGNVYRQLKDYQKAIHAYERADELRNAIVNDHQAERMLYVASASEVPLFEPTDEQQEYQNHSADYLRDVEPEFDNSIPESEWVPVEAEMLVNEVRYDPKTFSKWEVENVPATASLLDDRPKSESIVQESESDIALEVATVVEENTQLEETEPLVETDEQEPAEEAPDDSVQQMDEQDVQATESATEISEFIENELPTLEIAEEESFDDNNDVVISPTEPIAQAEDEMEMLLDEAEVVELEAGSQSEEEAVNLVPQVVEPADQIPQEEPELDFAPSVMQEGAVQIDELETTLTAEREINQEEEHLTKQIEINPRSATTWEALGTLYKTAGRYEEAVQAFKQAIAIAPETVSYHHNLGLVYAAQGNNEEAFKTFQEVLELDPNHSLTHASLGGYYKKTGLEELAQKHIGKAMKYIYESENEYNRACLDAICGNTDRAIQLLRVALENRQTYVDWVLNDPDLDSLRGDERFRNLVSEFSR